MSLKSKLIITICGPLTILVIVGLLSVRTVTLPSKGARFVFTLRATETAEQSA